MPLLRLTGAQVDVVSFNSTLSAMQKLGLLQPREEVTVVTAVTVSNRYIDPFEHRK